MDIERLTNTQIILLTLLVSFITSIATGIATVSLMEQAPTDVTRVISRIIEQPIETVTPGDTKTVVEQHTVVVSEAEQIASAVQKITPSLVRLYTANSRGNVADFKALGVIASADGAVVSDGRIVDRKQKYIAVLADGTHLAATASSSEAGHGFFKLDTTNHVQPFTAATFTPFNTLQLGQTVVVISGETTTRINPGVIAELTPSVGDAVSRFRATVDTTGIALGSPAVNLDGSVVGMPQDIGSQIFLTLSGENAQ